MSTDRGAARGNLTHFAVPEAREMLFDDMPSCPAYGGLSFDGIAVKADDQLYLIVRTPGARVYMGPDLSTVARRTQIIVVALIHGRVIHPEKGPAIAAWLRECWDSTFAEMQAAPKQ